MKKLLLALFLLTLLSFVCLAEEPRAYLTEEGGLIVTSLPYEGDEAGSLVLGSGERLPIECGEDELKTYHTSGRYSAAVKDGCLCAGEPGSAKVELCLMSGESVFLQVTVKKAPSGIAVSPESAELPIGRSGTLKVSLPDGSAGTVFFSSSDESVASVDAKGRVTAHTPGEAVITLTTYNGKTALSHITVPLPDPAKVIIPETLTGYALESVFLPVSLEGGWNESVSGFMSSDESVCRVHEDGTVECLREGTCDITVTESRGAFAVCRVTVLPCAQSIRPAADRIFLYAGGSTVPQAVTEGGSGSYAVSANENDIVLCDGSTVTAVSAGETDVLLTAVGGAQCLCPVTVYPLPGELSLRAEYEEPAAGERMSMTLWENAGVYLPVHFRVSDESIARVTDEGSLSFLGVGSVTVTAECGGVAFEKTFDVKAPASAVAFPESDLLLGVGDRVPCEAFCLDGGGRILYSVSGSAVSLENGILTAREEGTALVRAYLSTGVEGTLSVEVRPAAKKILTDYDTACVGEGDWLPLAWRFDGGEYNLVSVTVGGDGVLYENGVLTGLKEAQNVPVTLKTAPGVSKTVTVSVLPAPESILPCGEPLPRSERFCSLVTVKKGESLLLTAEAEGLSRVSFSCVSRDPEIATVEDNVLTGLKKGTACVTVSAYSGASADVLVEVR